MSTILLYIYKKYDIIIWVIILMYFSLKSDIEKNQCDYVASNTLVEKKSKFIAYIFNISCKNEAEDYLERIKMENKDARHIVYIYSYLDKITNIPVINFSDDGEPQGTGTKAIYELISKERITNICIVIVRYFGGILLGAGPLSRAYLNSFRATLIKCDKYEILNYDIEEYTIEYCKYENFKNKVSEYIDKRLIIIDSVKFNEKIDILIKIERTNKEQIMKKINEILF